MNPDVLSIGSLDNLYLFFYFLLNYLQQMGLPKLMYHPSFQNRCKQFFLKSFYNLTRLSFRQSRSYMYEIRSSNWSNFSLIVFFKSLTKPSDFDATLRDTLQYKPLPFACEDSQQQLLLTHLYVIQRHFLFQQYLN